MNSNLTGNAIHATSIAKKNWLFGKVARASSAVIHTLLEIAIHRGHESYADLRDVLASPGTKAGEMAALLPANCKPATILERIQAAS
ncbi:hypothetical protein [Luteolibacter sp. LG18]|uniref:hypothetical protein n=1 Tax=Luteolibacter sp. LG18 TaxID=2819286 RepID=UPI002B2AF3E5|nr:hypothetical protein llg_23070 [Luteolibacter sp. LG18]